MPASMLGKVGDLPGSEALRAPVSGDDGGVSYVCTACGRSWS
ncbi:hypothetical protein QFZ75_005116 [Streptomyces sp. V3I8]|nr:hypothetical protein [Streptomyces sp. V3I8]